MLRIRILYWPIVLLALWGCRKDAELFSPYAPSEAEISLMLQDKIPYPSTHQVFALDHLDRDTVLELPNGIRIYLIDTDHLFADAETGAPVLCSTCSDLRVELTEVTDKSDMIARGLNTVSENDTLFETGGMVKVTISCNNRLLSLLPDRTLKIDIPSTSPKDGFVIFNWNDNGSGSSFWTPTSQEVYKYEVLTGNVTEHGYQLLAKQLGWVACGKLLTDATSPFCVTLPTGFADQNTLAFVVFKDQNVVAPLTFDPHTGKFCSNKVPAGYKAHLLALSKLGDQYWLGKGDTEIGTNVNFTLKSNQLTEQAVLDFVKSL